MDRGHARRYTSPLSSQNSPLEYPFTVDSQSALSVSDDEQIARVARQVNALAITPTPGEEETSVSASTSQVEVDDVAYVSEDDEDLDDAAEETRLRYARLAARGRAAELAYNHRIQQEKERGRYDAVSNANGATSANQNANVASLAAASSSSRRDRSRSQSKSRPSTPILGALFKRDNFAMAVTRSQSPPVHSVPEKSSRRPSMTNLFKFKPLSRSSSSKSIHASSASSSQPTSPFPSPLTPLSPLPFFLSPKIRRKPMLTTGEDIEVAALTSGFGSPLTRTPRRPSPSRTMTLPDEQLYVDFSTPIPVRRRPSLGAGMGAHVHRGANRRGREASPLGRSENMAVPAMAPHLITEGALSLRVDAQG